MRALIAMSGGVDSSVAAALMIEKGYECIGATMKLYDNGENASDKPSGSADDIADAKAVADRLNMPHYVLDFQDDFKCKVMNRFVESYLKGITPNPCIECNRHLKFKQLYNKAKELDCDVIVTGHYARIEQDADSGRYVLKKAVDISKDQSYVLYNLTQEQLAHTVFPLGEYTKEEIRSIAEEKGFINARKHDSQDICFIPDGNYKRFIEEYANKTCPEGDFVDVKGNVLGTHTGICNYTIGQRKGLGISSTAPLYVKDIDVANNKVVLSDNDSLFSNELVANDFNWVSIPKPENTDGIRVDGKIRYRHNPESAVCIDEGDKVRVIFDKPQRAITCGQAVVLYDGDAVIGGGTIIEK